MCLKSLRVQAHSLNILIEIPIIRRLRQTLRRMSKLTRQKHKPLYPGSRDASSQSAYEQAFIGEPYEKHSNFSSAIDAIGPSSGGRRIHR